MPSFGQWNDNLGSSSIVNGSSNSAFFNPIQSWASNVSLDTLASGINLQTSTFSVLYDAGGNDAADRTEGVISQGRSSFSNGARGFAQSFIDTAARLTTYGYWSPYDSDVLYGTGAANPSGDIKFCGPSQTGARWGQVVQMILSFGLSYFAAPAAAAENTASLAAPGARMTVGGVPATQIGGRLSTSEMAALQAQHRTEFAQVYLTGAGRNGGGGTYYLIQGSADNVSIPIGSNVRLINHTHPTVLNGATVPLRASGADRNVMNLLQQAGSPQRTSQVVTEAGETFLFTR
jgi:hypothetical protein